MVLGRPIFPMCPVLNCMAEDSPRVALEWSPRRVLESRCTRVQGRTRTSTHSNVLRAGPRRPEEVGREGRYVRVWVCGPRTLESRSSPRHSRSHGRADEGKKGDDLTGSRSLEDNGRLVTMNQPLLREHQMKFPSTAADGTQRCAQLDSSAGEAGSVPSSVT